MCAPLNLVLMVLLPFEPQSHLAGPRPGPYDSRAVEVAGVTGGRLVAVVEAGRGLRSLWRGRENLLPGGLELSRAGMVLLGDDIRFGPGSWERRISLPEGQFLIERGLLPDVGNALVLQWELLSPADSPSSSSRVTASQLCVRPGSEDPNGSVMALPLVSGTPSTLLVVPETEVPERAVQLLRPLEGRERQRANRSRVGEAESFRILVNGMAAPGIVESLNALDESALFRGQEEMAPLFFAGIADGIPRYLDGTHLTEVGLAALLSGRRSLARNVLEAVAGDEDVPALPFLHLAGQWTHWTGDPRVLLPLRAALDQAVRSLAPSPSSASLPHPSKALRDFIEGVEALGDAEWNGSLRRKLERLNTPAPTSRRRTLPLLGWADTAHRSDQDVSLGDGEDLKSDPQLPPPDSFADPDHAGILARKTIQGARILRSWIEGQLGARPDSSFGRLRLAPGIQLEWESFEASGLSVGDALISLRVWQEEDGYRIALSQDGGKVPINLIFEPLLPLDRVTGVWIDGESAEVNIEPEGGGTRLRFQLPLDGERRIRVTGATSATASSPF